MSRTPGRDGVARVKEMEPEYRLDYSQGRRNRFAQRMQEEAVTVVLDPDVAAVFTTSESVNDLLRSVIAALPARKQAAATPRHRRKAG
jgi:hypothetical protein